MLEDARRTAQRWRRSGAARAQALVAHRGRHAGVAAMINIVGLIVGLLVLVVFTGLPMWALSVIVARSATC